MIWSNPGSLQKADLIHTMRLTGAVPCPTSGCLCLHHHSHVIIVSGDNLTHIPHPQWPLDDPPSPRLGEGVSMCLQPISPDRKVDSISCCFQATVKLGCPDPLPSLRTRCNSTPRSSCHSIFTSGETRRQLLSWIQVVEDLPISPSKDIKSYRDFTKLAALKLPISPWQYL